MTHSFESLRYIGLELDGSSQQQNQRRLFDERQDAEEYQRSYEQRANRVCNLPPEILDEYCWNNDTDATQCIG